MARLKPRPKDVGRFVGFKESVVKDKYRRLALRNEAQRDAVCWASQAQRQPTKGLLRHPLLGRGC